MHISSILGPFVLLFGNEEKLVVLVHSSLRRVPTIMIRRISVFISSGSQVSQVECKWVVNTDSLRIQYSITAHLKGCDDYDVTRQVATEHVQNKYSLLKSFSLLNSPVAIGSIINSTVEFSTCYSKSNQ